MTIKKSSSSGIPSGLNAGRPANPGFGQLYANGETARLELFTQASGWQNIVQETPGVSSITGNYLEATNSGTITIQGTNFVSGAIASAIGADGVEVLASSTTYNSLVQLTAVFTGLSNANEPYDIKVTNPSSLFGLIPDALYINASPVWQTASGSLGTFNEQVSVNLSATATDSDSTISYALASGSTLPSGVSLNSSTGAITGTLPNITTDTTYSFTVNATDGLNVIPRAFSITSNSVTENVEILVVAGGGSGGGIGAGFQGQRAAGGGAGGLIYINSFPIQGGQYSISVGQGGSNGGNGTARGQGQNSIFSGNSRTLTALGGGIGAQDDSTNNATEGGSGGGSWYPGYVGKSATQPSTTNDGISTYPSTGFGNKGGDSGNTQPYGGGGGGAGAAGNNFNSAGGPVGGIGKQYSITGAATYYAGGGGAAGFPPETGTYQEYAGGLGGGGTGSNNGFDPISNGAANTGGGGGSGGAGGSGVVIIAYPNTFAPLSVGNGLTYDQPTRSGYRVYRFTAGTGTITF